MCEAATVNNMGLASKVAGPALSAFGKSKGEKTGYEQNAAAARNNAQIAEWQAQDALDRGANEKNRIQLSGARLEGKQRAILASRNVDITEGSAANILVDTRFMQKRDEAQAETNAANEAWALRSRAAGYRSSADMLAYRAKGQSPFMDAAGTALTEGSKVASGWQSWSKTKGAANPSVWEHF